MKVWFDSDGRALCAQRGDMNATGPEGSILMDVAGDSDINRIALIDGEVVDRQLMTIVADRTIIRADGQDATHLSGIAQGAALLIDGQMFPAQHDLFALTSAQPCHRIIEPALGHYGPLVQIQFQTGEDIAVAVRKARDARLAACDWTQALDAPLSEQVRAAWQAYRQTLRDLPAAQPTATIETVIWPSLPAN
jgi:hypothetical protein